MFSHLNRTHYKFCVVCILSITCGSCAQPFACFKASSVVPFTSGVGEVYPITHFPASHFLADNGVCGFSFSAGDAIPHQGMWRDEVGIGQCTVVSGAELFFSFMRGSSRCPTSWCSHTGIDEPNTVVIYFVQDAAGELSLGTSFASLYYEGNRNFSLPSHT